jgi:hypothetical protein
MKSNVGVEHGMLITVSLTAILVPRLGMGRHYEAWGPLSTGDASHGMSITVPSSAMTLKRTV